MNHLDLMDSVDTHSREYDSTLVMHNGAMRVEEFDIATGATLTTHELWAGKPIVEIKAGSLHRITATANGTLFTRLRAAIGSDGNPAIVSVDD
jgi:hypothetical protein